MMELFLQVYSKPSQIQPPPFALCVLFIECGVFFSPRENVSPIHKQCNNFITFLWLTGLNCNLDINNESAFYFLVADHTSTNKHMGSGSLPAKSLYPTFHSFIPIVSTIFKNEEIPSCFIEAGKATTWRRGTCAEIYTILWLDIYEDVYCNNNQGTVSAPTKHCKSLSTCPFLLSPSRKSLFLFLTWNKLWTYPSHAASGA